MAFKRVAIVGAGPCGLAAIKSCLEENLEPVCFEMSDNIGGMWKYSEEVNEGQACVSYTTIANTSKELMCFSDFPVHKESANFMHHTQVFEYLQQYTDHFGLEKHIKFRHEVTKVTRSDTFAVDGKWEISFKSIDVGEVTAEMFDAVMLCTGHHAGKYQPTFEGEDVFQGRIMHSQEYRDHVGFHGKKVVVIGLGNSAGDAAVDLSRIARQVVLSTHRGAWVIPRTADNGIPVDYYATRRWVNNFINSLPRNTKNSMLEAKVNARYDHALYGLLPEHRIDAQPPVLNDDLPNRILNGTIRLRPGVSRFTKNGIEFTDGSSEEDVDVIIMATGYIVDFTYLEKGIVEVVENKMNLFKEVFPPDLQPATLAVIGLFRAFGSVHPPAELQCRWATRIFKGLNSLPSKEEMDEDNKKKRQEMTARFLPVLTNIIRVEFIPFMDELAKQVGCKPNIGHLLLRDPWLALHVFFGPCSAYQYRLQGPGQWSGAKEAILTQYERMCAPMKTRQVPKRQASSKGFKLFKLIIIILVAVVIKSYLL